MSLARRPPKAESAGNSDGASNADQGWWRTPAGIGMLVVAVIGAAAVLLVPFIEHHLSDGQDELPTPVTSQPSSRTPSDQSSEHGLQPSSPPSSVQDKTDIIRRTEQQIEIAAGFGIDLDSTEADWGETTATAQVDFKYENDGTIRPEEFKLVDAAPDRAACDTPGYRRDGVEAATLPRGTVLCLRSDGSERHLARMKILEVEQEKLTVDILVWG
jgi:hypothetical protein